MLRPPPRGFVVVTFPMQLDFREIGRPLLFLAGWKRQKTAFPPPLAMLGGGANQFATLVSRETGM